MLTIKRITYSDFVSRKDQLLFCILELKNQSENESEKLLNNMAVFLKDKSAIIYVALFDHKIVGFIWGYNINEQTSHVNYFVVLREYRHVGIGSKLLKEFLFLANRNVELLVDKQNSSAINFYNKKGFKKEFFNDSKYKMIWSVD